MVPTRMPGSKRGECSGLAVVVSSCEVAAGYIGVVTAFVCSHTSTLTSRWALPFRSLSTAPIASMWPCGAIAKSSHRTSCWESAGRISCFIVPVPISKNRIDCPPQSTATLFPSGENATGFAQPGTVTSHSSMPDRNVDQADATRAGTRLSSSKRCVPIANNLLSGENAMERVPPLAVVLIKLWIAVPVWGFQRITPFPQSRSPHPTSSARQQLSVRGKSDRVCVVVMPDQIMFERPGLNVPHLQPTGTCARKPSETRRQTRSEKSANEPPHVANRLPSGENANDATLPIARLSDFQFSGVSLSASFAASSSSDCTSSPVRALNSLT